MLTFNKIVNQEIFTEKFSKFEENNQIHFSKDIAVIYGPNGTGKTSLINAIEGNRGAKIEYSFEGQSYTEGKDVFYIIHDQDSRNIITGDAQDFFLGDDIKNEFKLRDLVKQNREELLDSVINSLKKGYKISAASSPLVKLLADDALQKFVKDCANNKSKGSAYSDEELANYLSDLEKNDVGEFSEEKLEFITDDYLKKEGSIVDSLETIEGIGILPNGDVREIEENDEAIRILRRFEKKTCIVCDNENIDRNKLLRSKESNRKNTYNKLEENVRTALELTLASLSGPDPFEIKEHLLDAIEKGSIETIIKLQFEFKEYKKVFQKKLINDIFSLFEANDFGANFNDYKRIIESKPEISDEDFLYIQEIINGSMEKELIIERDQKKNLQIKLADSSFLGKDRRELPLSTGEQNFLSLAFEFLKAKNTESNVVVIDDPISSFDSIYKNKVVYAIVKILDKKKRIILTHNMDFIRLLNGQYQNCFELYLLNNTDGEINGFIPVSKKEQGLIVNLRDLVKNFRKDIPLSVKNPENYLIAVVPFMRSYAGIVGNDGLYRSLTKVMHGYRNDAVDIARAYNELFGEQKDALPNSYTISAKDIILKDIYDLEIVDDEDYPLLNRSLRYSVIFLYLRLKVEKELVSKCGIDTRQHNKLGQIITAAFPDEHDKQQVKNRVRLTSKKTLLNEFNHFEGDLSIFQPSIDITEKALMRECNDLEEFVKNLLIV